MAEPGPARDSVAAGSVLVGESIEFAIPSRRRAIHGGARFSREFARNGRGGAGRPSGRQLRFLQLDRVFGVQRRLHAIRVRPRPITFVDRIYRRHTRTTKTGISNV